MRTLPTTRSVRAQLLAKVLLLLATQVRRTGENCHAIHAMTVHAQRLRLGTPLCCIASQGRFKQHT